MKKTILILLAGMPFVGMAQIEAPEFDENDDENEVEVLNEDVNETGFDFPEALTDANLDSLMNLYMMKTYLTTADDCQMLSENPEFSHDVYRDRLKRMPTIMDMAYNDVVRSCIDRYMVRLRRQVSYMLGAANFYMSWLLILAGLVILLFAVMNYINLTMAQSTFRMREMAMRRLLGSQRSGVIMRLMGESHPPPRGSTVFTLGVI